MQAGKLWCPFVITLIGSVTILVTALLSFRLIAIYPGLMSTIEKVFRVDDLLGTEILLLALAFAVGILLEMVIMIAVAVRDFSFTFKGFWTIISIKFGCISFRNFSLRHPLSL